MKNRNPYRPVLLLAIAALLLAACQSAPGLSPAAPVDETPQPGAMPAPVEAARQALADQLGIDPDSIRILMIEAVQWSNACLGVEVAGQMCAEVITPGYKVVLEVNGDTYIFHTDETGREVILTMAPEAQVDDPVIAWEQAGDGHCTMASIAPEGLAFGPCDLPMMAGVFVYPHRQKDVTSFSEKYASFQAVTPAGKVNFAGQGKVSATPAEQRMIAEWARLVYQEASAGHGAASGGLAYAWHREGGLAGFCDDVTVYVSGEAYASSCLGDRSHDYGRAFLSSDQLANLYDWLDNLDNFEYSHKDPATADAMTVQIVFSGTGQLEPTDADIQAIQHLSQEILAELTAPRSLY